MAGAGRERTARLATVTGPGAYAGLGSSSRRSVSVRSAWRASAAISRSSGSGRAWKPSSQMVPMPPVPSASMRSAARWRRRAAQRQGARAPVRARLPVDREERLRQRRIGQTGGQTGAVAAGRGEFLDGARPASVEARACRPRARTPAGGRAAPPPPPSDRGRYRRPAGVAGATPATNPESVWMSAAAQQQSLRAPVDFAGAAPWWRWAPAGGCPAGRREWRAAPRPEPPTFSPSRADRRRDASFQCSARQQPPSGFEERRLARTRLPHPCKDKKCGRGLFAPPANFYCPLGGSTAD